MKKKFNKTYCKKFKISDEKKIKHKKIEKTIFYKKLIKNYDYVNENIIKKIFYSIQ